MNLKVLLIPPKVEEEFFDDLAKLDFFSFARKRQLSKKSLKTLASYALYQRITSLYPL